MVALLPAVPVMGLAGRDGVRLDGCGISSLRVGHRDWQCRAATEAP